MLTGAKEVGRSDKWPDPKERQMITTAGFSIEWATGAFWFCAGITPGTTSFQPLQGRAVIANNRIGRNEINRL